MTTRQSNPRQPGSQGNVVRPTMQNLLKTMIDIGASDLHVSAGEVPSLRVDGQIRRLDNDQITGDDARRLAYSIMNHKQRARFEEVHEVDFSLGLKGLARFRVNVFTQARGVGMVLRHIPNKVWGLDDIHGPQSLVRIADSRQGLVLVTGPTGSGKSTTLAAILDHINRTRSQHIITIEDPVECLHVPIRCMINQREVGTHTLSFANALRAALRQDPDIIMVGEMRDLETISLALTAAETGHLVFGTLHTNSAANTIDRIVDVFPSLQQFQIQAMLSSSLLAVVSQQLVPRHGRRGRVAAFEVMWVTQAIRTLIRDRKLHQIPGVMQASRGEGMQTMETALRTLVNHREITQEQMNATLAGSH